MKTLLFAVLLVTASCLATAHHGTAVNYDHATTIVVKGVVTEFRWRNPHSALFLDVTKEDGSIVNFAIELPSPTLMSRGDYGWSRHSFKPGDVVEFEVHPSRTGAPVAVNCESGCKVLVNGQAPSNK